MTLTDQVIKNIIKRLIKGQDYRIEVVALINAEFLQFAIDFFKKVIEAKLQNENVTIDWYKKVFLNPKLSADEIAIHSGLNKKTITNMFNSATKEIVIDASNEHYDILYQSITSLIEHESEIDLTLTIKFRGVSVELNINESLIVINTLAVKRAALRGGLWSTAGKRVEKYLIWELRNFLAIQGKNRFKPIFSLYKRFWKSKHLRHFYKISVVLSLMATLCKVCNVPPQHFDQSQIPESMREVDFYLINEGKYYRCEVKLMGKGNPESADAIFARESNVFVADKLSDLNKQQAEMLNVHWVELRSDNGYKRFGKVLDELKIPYSLSDSNLESRTDAILAELFSIV